MKKTNFVTLVAILTCSAQEAEPSQKKKEFIHDFMVGIGGQHYQYSEATPEQKHAMHFKGGMGTIEGSYQMTYKDYVFLRPEIRLAYGKVEYEDCRAKSALKNVPSAIVEPRFLIGTPWKATEELTLSFYTGIGHRYKWDDSSNIQIKDGDFRGQFGAKRRNYYWYIPAGIRFRYDITPVWSLQLLTEYDFFLSGRQYQGGETDIDPPFKAKQTQGKGMRGEFLVGRQFEKFAVSTGLYGHYSKIKKTDRHPYHFVNSEGWEVTGAPYEPKNVSTEIGLKCNIHF